MGRQVRAYVLAQHVPAIHLLAHRQRRLQAARRAKKIRIAIATAIAVIMRSVVG